MTANGKQIDVHLINIDRKLSDTLSGICVEENLVFSTDLANLLDWLHDTDLVVHMDDGAHESVGSDRALESLKVDEAIFFDGKICDLEALILKLPAGVKDALVVDLSSDNVTLLISVEGCESLDGQVVGLSCATGEDDLL